ncbi:MAG: phosphopantothenoylcysteine decarboxylase [Elusimicrobiota bacterium]
MRLDGVKILITAGPTKEKWDTVRYLTNRSSGRTGLSIAKKACEKGALVTVVSCMEEHDVPGVKHVHAESAADMYTAVRDIIKDFRIFISAAAVCDFKPVAVNGKIKKRSGVPVIKLERTVDILEWAGRETEGKVIVGFSLSDSIDIENGQKKMKDKNCSIMVVNDTSNMGSSQRKTFVLISGTDREEYNDLSLDETAEVILKKCEVLLEKS